MLCELTSIKSVERRRARDEHVIKSRRIIPGPIAELEDQENDSEGGTMIRNRRLVIKGASPATPLSRGTNQNILILVSTIKDNVHVRDLTAIC